MHARQEKEQGNQVFSKADTTSRSAPVDGASPRLGGDYWTVWSASTASFAGDGFTAGALPLLALSMTRDARLIAAADALLMAGWLLLGLVAGVVADRADRLGIMWRVDVCRTLLMAGLVVTVLTGVITIPVLLVIALLLGFASPFFDNASSSVVPELVPAELLEKANSLNQVPMMVATNLVGPPLGALLFALSHPAPFVVDTVSFAVAALLILRLARRRRSHISAVKSETNPDPWPMLRAGVSYLAHHRTLRTLAAAGGAMNAVAGGLMAVLVLYATEHLGMPARQFGWLIATFAVGALVGSLLTAPLVRRCGTSACMVASLLTLAVAVTLLGTTSRVTVAILLLMLTGVCAAVWNAVTITYRHRAVPPEMLGRVTSAYSMILFMGMPIGAILMGFMTNWLGTARAYLIGGLALLVVGLVVAPFLRDLPTGDAVSSDSR